ncbi:MAG: hypothetical protein Q8T09_20170 [Candidatus Melainabacteria bacterium]|nr:hypothetical protein [Candidatus Melainabacteria bacterium]
MSLNFTLSSKHSKNRKKRRSETAASLILVIACGFGLMALIYGLFSLAMFLGGSRQVRNAADAGALNVSRKMMDIRVPTDPKYADVADTNGKVGMSNVNRLWGKAYLINANLEEMQKSGQAGPKATGNGDAAYQIAQTVNDNLYSELASSKTQDLFFNQMAGRRTANMINPGMGIDKNRQNTCPIAMVDRGDESNLVMTPGQIPAGITVGKVDKGSKSYMQGYVPMTANNKKFTFTSFHEGEQPHLISDSVFDPNRADIAPIEGSATVIPNAFRQSALASNGSLDSTATASAVANPIRSYSMTIPQSYVTIHVLNMSNWFVDGKKIRSIGYETKADQTIHGLVDHQTPTRVINCFGKLGGEYASGHNIMAIIKALKADYEPAMKKLLQRIQGMDPSFTMAKLTKMLENQNYDKNVSRYYIFAKDDSADHTDPQIQIQADTGSLPTWIDVKNWQEDFDGTPKDLVTEPTTTDQYANAWQSPPGTPQPTAKNSGVMIWQPGSGYTKAVGNLFISRTTNLNFSSKP